MNRFAQAANRKHRRYGTMYECLLCPCRDVKSKMEKHHLEQHMKSDEVPFRCKACEARFLHEEEARKHHQKKHPDLEFLANIQRSTSPFCLKEDRARSLGHKRSLELFEEEARKRQVVDEESYVLAGLTEFLSRGGTQSNLLLTQVQALADKGSLVPAIKTHLKATETVVAPATSPMSTQTAEEREEEFLRELEVSDTNSDDDEQSDEAPPEVPAAAGGETPLLDEPYRGSTEPTVVTTMAEVHPTPNDVLSPPLDTELLPPPADFSDVEVVPPPAPSFPPPRIELDSTGAMAVDPRQRAVSGLESTHEQPTSVPAVMVGDLVRETVCALTSAVKLSTPPATHPELLALQHSFQVTNSTLGQVSAKLTTAVGHLADTSAVHRDVGALLEGVRQPLQTLSTHIPTIARAADKMTRSVDAMTAEMASTRASNEAMMASLNATIGTLIDRTNKQQTAFERVHNMYTGFLEDQRRGGQTTKAVQKLLNLDYDPDGAAPSVRRASASEPRATQASSTTVTAAQATCSATQKSQQSQPRSRSPARHSNKKRTASRSPERPGYRASLSAARDKGKKYCNRKN
jgi:hypothetical protein